MLTIAPCSSYTGIVYLEPSHPMLCLRSVSTEMPRLYSNHSSLSGEDTRAECHPSTLAGSGRSSLRVLLRPTARRLPVGGVRHSLLLLSNTWSPPPRSHEKQNHCCVLKLIVALRRVSSWNGQNMSISPFGRMVSPARKGARSFSAL